MKAQQKAAAIITTLLLVGTPASAIAAGLVLAASIGQASLSEDFDGLKVDDSSTAFRVSVGWRFNDYFSLEGGYHDFGDFAQSLDDAGETFKARLSADGFTVGVGGRMPFSERFALTGRAGLFFWNGTAEVNDVSVASPDDTNLYLGAGLSFDVSDRFQLTTDWTRYELEGAASAVFSVGLQYEFR